MKGRERTKREGMGKEGRERKTNLQFAPSNVKLSIHPCNIAL